LFSFKKLWRPILVLQAKLSRQGEPGNWRLRVLAFRPKILFIIFS
jgi:hypothetical protein